MSVYRTIGPLVVIFVIEQVVIQNKLFHPSNPINSHMSVNDLWVSFKSEVFSAIEKFIPSKMTKTSPANRMMKSPPKAQVPSSGRNQPSGLIERHVDFEMGLKHWKTKHQSSTQN